MSDSSNTKKGLADEEFWPTACRTVDQSTWEGRKDAETSPTETRSAQKQSGKLRRKQLWRSFIPPGLMIFVRPPISILIPSIETHGPPPQVRTSYAVPAGKRNALSNTFRSLIRTE